MKDITIMPAGIMADYGWNVYFPRRDKGFHFIITRPHEGTALVRPVQYSLLRIFLIARRERQRSGADLGSASFKLGARSPN
jgi:hypothetical protein